MLILDAIIGFVSGIFGGLGMGGGTVLIPMLTIFLGIEQKTAQGINLLAFVIMAIFSLMIHIKNGYVETKGLFFIIFGGVIFSCGGAFIAILMPSSLLRIFFGVFLCFLAILEMIKVFKDKK